MTLAVSESASFGEFTIVLCATWVHPSSPPFWDTSVGGGYRCAYYATRSMARRLSAPSRSRRLAGGAKTRWKCGRLRGARVRSWHDGTGRFEWRDTSSRLLVSHYRPESVDLLWAHPDYIVGSST